MGAGIQEEIALLLQQEILMTDIYTSGAFITQSSEKLDYYPFLINFLNLRWLYRAIKVSHVRKRLFSDYPRNIIWLFRNRSITQELIQKLKLSEKLLRINSKQFTN